MTHPIASAARSMLFRAGMALLLFLVAVLATPAVQAVNAVIPIVESVVAEPGGANFTITFGYYNAGAAVQGISYGSRNYMSPGQQIRFGQPASFLPGRHHALFSATIPAGTLNWHLDGFTAAADTSRPFSPAPLSYQGELRREGERVNGLVNLRASLWTAQTGGTYPVGAVTLDGEPGNPPKVSVVNGVLNAQLPFRFAVETQLWLQIEVQAPGDAAYVPLGARQQVLPTPMANAANFSQEAAFAYRTAGYEMDSAKILMGREVNGDNLLRMTPGTWSTGNPPIAARLDVISETTGETRMLRLDSRTGVSRDPAVNALEIEGNASKSAAGDWLANSDARIKTDVQNVTGALKPLRSCVW